MQLSSAPLTRPSHTNSKPCWGERGKKTPNTIRDTFISLSHLCSFSLIQEFWQACVQLAPTPYHPALQEKVPSLFLPSLLERSGSVLCLLIPGLEITRYWCMCLINYDLNTITSPRSEELQPHLVAWPKKQTDAKKSTFKKQLSVLTIGIIMSLKMYR